jgi:hypothetical protein
MHRPQSRSASNAIAAIDVAKFSPPVAPPPLRRRPASWSCSRADAGSGGRAPSRDKKALETSD